MARLPRTRYTREFKVHAVSMAKDEGLGIAETARRLSISPQTIANWVKLAHAGRDFAKQSAASFFSTKLSCTGFTGLPSEENRIPSEKITTRLDTRREHYSVQKRIWGTCAAAVTPPSAHLLFVPGRQIEGDGFLAEQGSDENE